MTSLRTLIRIDISIDQDWAVGAAPDLWFRPDAIDVDDDARSVRLPVQRDPAGGLLLPATSLVGSLRRHLGDEAVSWLGSAQSGNTVPSELRCLAATVHPVESRTVTTTAIDPGRRAASGGMLRREEVLPPALVTWWVEWDHHDPTLRLADLVARLKHWRPVVGRRRSANRGRAHVVAIWHRTVDLATQEGLSWWLGDRPSLPWAASNVVSGPEWVRAAGTEAHEGAPVIKRTFRVEDGLHIGGHGANGNLIFTGRAIPSTSWRGLFRSRVAHIVRVSTEGADDAAEERVSETVARLFGSGRGKGKAEGSGHRGQIRFGDSPIVGSLRQRTHVAIDRISGGAVVGYAIDPKDDSGMLFTVEHFGPGAVLDLAIYNDSTTEVSDEDLSLLHGVIRDIEQGVVGLGGMTSRGYGTLASQGERG